MAVQLGARLVEVADAATALVAAAWEPALPDECTRDYADEAALKDLDGRKVFVLPAGAVTVQRATRAKLLNEYRLSVRVVERYADAGKPLAEWIDDRVAWLDTVLGALDVTDPAAWLLGSLWCETIEVTDACNPDELVVRKLFWAEIEVAYREHAAA